MSANERNPRKRTSGKTSNSLRYDEERVQRVTDEVNALSARRSHEATLHRPTTGRDPAPHVAKAVAGKTVGAAKAMPRIDFLMESIQIVYMNVNANSFHLDATAGDRASGFRMAISAPGANRGCE
jgi:hypothetical protein